MTLNNCQKRPATLTIAGRFAFSAATRPGFANSCKTRGALYTYSMTYPTETVTGISFFECTACDFNTEDVQEVIWHENTAYHDMI